MDLDLVTILRFLTSLSKGPQAKTNKALYGLGPAGFRNHYLALATGSRTSVRIQRSTMSAPPAVFSNEKVS